MTRPDTGRGWPRANRGHIILRPQAGPDRRWESVLEQDGLLVPWGAPWWVAEDQDPLQVAHRVAKSLRARGFRVTIREPG